MKDSSAHEPIACNIEGFVADGESESAHRQFYDGKNVHVVRVCLDSIFQYSALACGTMLAQVHRYTVRPFRSISDYVYVHVRCQQHCSQILCTI